MGAFSRTWGAGISGGQGTLLNYYTPFKIPVGATYLPVTTTDGWSLLRTGGTPAAEISLVDISPSDAIKIKSNKAIRFKTGVTGHTSNYANYTLAAPVSIVAKSIMLWVRLVEGVGIEAYNKASQVMLKLYSGAGTTNAYNYILGINNSDYKSPGWYAFSLTPSLYSSVSGTPSFENITAIGVGCNKLATDSPILEIGMISVAANAGKAQICFMADGGYGSHDDIADLLTANGMNGTFYISDTANFITDAKLLEMQSNGHLISSYLRDWGTTLDSGLENAITLISNVKAWLQSKGLNGGRYLVQGTTGGITDEAWNAIVPQYADNFGFIQRNLTSKFHKTYTGRYHQFNAASKDAIIAIVNQAVTDKSKFGILVHEQVGADYTAFEDFVVNTLLPLQTAGSIEVITVKQAFDSV